MSVPPIMDLGLGTGCFVKGTLYDTLDPLYLQDDLLEVDFPSGETASVEWNEEFCLFEITLFKDYLDNRLRFYRAWSPENVVGILQMIEEKLAEEAKA